MVLGDRENVRSIEKSVCDMIVKGAHRFIRMRASLRARKSNQMYKMSKNGHFFDFFSQKKMFFSKKKILKFFLFFFFDLKLHKSNQMYGI